MTKSRGIKSRKTNARYAEIRILAAADRARGLTWGQIGRKYEMNRENISKLVRKYLLTQGTATGTVVAHIGGGLQCPTSTKSPSQSTGDH